MNFQTWLSQLDNAVDNYRVQYAYLVDAKDPDYKAPYNQPFNISRVYKPEDKAVQTPNSDTPYSWVGLDLRPEPIVFTAPKIAVRTARPSSPH